MTSVRITPSQLTPRIAEIRDSGDRLLVGDHGECLQRRLGQPRRLPVEDEPLDVRRVSGRV